MAWSAWADKQLLKHSAFNSLAWRSRHKRLADAGFSPYRPVNAISEGLADGVVPLGIRPAKRD
jgi:hypothetical protein